MGKHLYEYFPPAVLWHNLRALSHQDSLGTWDKCSCAENDSEERMTTVCCCALHHFLFLVCWIVFFCISHCKQTTPEFTCKQTMTHVFRQTRICLFDPEQSLDELSHLPKWSALSVETNLVRLKPTKQLWCERTHWCGLYFTLWTNNLFSWRTSYFIS